MFNFNLNLLKFAFDTFNYVNKKCLEEFPTTKPLPNEKAVSLVLQIPNAKCPTNL